MQESGSSASLADMDNGSLHAAASDASSTSCGYVVKGNIYQGAPANHWRSSSLQQLHLQQQQLQQLQLQARRQSEALESVTDCSFANEPAPSSATLPVSARVKQLQDTLARLKRRPLLLSPTAAVAAAPSRGLESLPLLGAAFADEDRPASAAAAPASIDEALQRHASEASGKLPAITCVETDGKLGRSLTYAKLYSSARKLAHYLLNKVGHKGAGSLKPGDKAAILLPAGDVCTLAVAFAACQLAGLVPVPVEPPPTATQETGQMLAALEARAVLTSESFYRTLKTQSQHEPPSYTGWPGGLHWILADSSGLAKPTKDWRPPQSTSTPVLAYAECGPARDGTPRAVCVTRAALMAHGRALCSALGYARGDAAVCLLDARRDVGLWHGLVAAMLSGMHVYFVPYLLMKAEPLAWLRLVAKQRVSFAWAKSRDLYWSLLAGRDDSATSSISLASLKCLLVADSANPWSLTSCDSFLACYRHRGLNQNCLVTCAYSPESLTVSIRRPALSVGRAVISMHGLSYGLVQVDSDAAYTSMTLQDCGHLLPASAVAIVRLGRPGATEPRPQLCRVDEMGEVCVCSRYAAARYAGADSPNERVFNCRPVSATGDDCGSGDPADPDGAFVRTGLLGFVGPPTSGGLLFVCGTIATQLCVAKRRHSADDLIATVLAIEPLKFVHRGRIAIFGQPLLGDDRIVVVAEQRPEASDSRCHKWACDVLQAIETIHQVSVYCLALVPANTLPRNPHGSVDTVAVRQLYSAGRIRPCRVLMCPQAAVADMLDDPTTPFANANSDDSSTALAIEPQTSAVDGASSAPTLPCLTLTDALRWRGTREPDARLLSVCCDSTSASSSSTDSAAVAPDSLPDIVASCSISEPLTSQTLLKRSERVASLVRAGLQLSQQQAPAVVAVAAAPGPDLLSGIFGAMLAGCVPAVMRPPAPAPSSLAAFARLVRLADSAGVIVSQPVAKLLKAKSSQPHLRPTLPPLLELDKAKKAAEKASSAVDADGSGAGPKTAAQTDPDAVAYLDLCGASGGNLSDDLLLSSPTATTGSAASPGSNGVGVRVTHRVAMAACQCLQTRCDLQLGRDLPACLDLYSGGMAFIVACLASVACGHHTLLMPAGQWELTASGAAGFLQMLAQRTARDALCGYELLDRCCARLQPETVKQKHSLASLRSLVVLGNERPRADLLAKFGRLLVPLGLSPSALRCSFGCRAVPCLTLPSGATDSSGSATIYADAKALREDRLVPVDSDSPNAIVLMEAGQPIADARVSLATPAVRGADVGEILVKLRGNQLATRTGYLGVIRQLDESRPPALFVVGSLTDSLTGLGGASGLRYYPADLEASAIRCHPAVIDCAVFACDTLLAIVLEINCRESDALDAVPQSATALLREHQLVASIVVVCEPGAIPTNSRGEKLHSVLRDRFLNDRLDPVYVAYNL